MAAPEVGTVVDGYRFKGGNHRDRGAWERVSMDGMQAAPPEWGDGAVVIPGGKVLGPPGPRGGARKELGSITDAGAVVPEVKEYQANAAARATLMDEGQRKYDEARREGYDPTRDAIPRAVEGVPWVGPFIANVIRDNPSEKARAAELQFVDGALRTTSGANAPEPETVRANKQYFQQPGENDAVEADRRMLRDRFRNTSIRAAGPGYLDPYAPGASPKTALTLGQGQSRNTIPKGAYYRDAQGNVRRNDNGDRGNPIIQKAPGVQPPKAAPRPAAKAPPKAPAKPAGGLAYGGRPVTPQEAAKLPKGTKYKTTDGRIIER
jgi:hypothetical protein